MGCGGIFAFVNSQLKSRARARSKPSLHRRRHEARDEARLEVDLQVDAEVERPARLQRAAHVAEALHAGRAVEEHDVVDRGVSAHERRRAGLQHPRHVRVGLHALERGEERQHVHGVADGAHHHDADAAQRHVPVRRIGASRHAGDPAHVVPTLWPGRQTRSTFASRPCRATTRRQASSSSLTARPRFSRHFTSERSRRARFASPMAWRRSLADGLRRQPRDVEIQDPRVVGLVVGGAHARRRAARS